MKTYTLPKELIDNIAIILRERWFTYDGAGLDWNDEPVIAASKQLDAELASQQASRPSGALLVVQASLEQVSAMRSLKQIKDTAAECAEILKQEAKAQCKPATTERI
jgi:hypothetical protein